MRKSPKEDPKGAGSSWSTPQVTFDPEPMPDRLHCIASSVPDDGASERAAFLRIPLAVSVLPPRLFPFAARGSPHVVLVRGQV